MRPDAVWVAQILMGFYTPFAFYSLHTRIDRTHMDTADLASEVIP